MEGSEKSSSVASSTPRSDYLPQDIVVDVGDLVISSSQFDNINNFSKYFFNMCSLGS